MEAKMTMKILMNELIILKTIVNVQQITYCTCGAIITVRSDRVAHILGFRICYTITCQSIGIYNARYNN